MNIGLCLDSPSGDFANLVVVVKSPGGVWGTLTEGGVVSSAHRALVTHYSEQFVHGTAVPVVHVIMQGETLQREGDTSLLGLRLSGTSGPAEMDDEEGRQVGEAGVLATDVCPAAMRTLPLLAVGPEVNLENLLKRERLSTGHGDTEGGESPGAPLHLFATSFAAHHLPHRPREVLCHHGGT